MDGERPIRCEVIGRATLFLADCADVRDRLGSADALVADPPYGQRVNTNVVGAKGLRTYRNGNAGGGRAVIDGNARTRVTAAGIHSTRLATQYPDALHGDDRLFDPAPWLGAAPRVLLWGAHRFAHLLPPGSWLVWDKVPTGKVRDQGDGEAAWINDPRPKPLRIKRLLWDGVCVGPEARAEVTAGQPRVHPTQKPIAIMDWCLDQLGLPVGATVLDPYMGAGSTGVAAVRRGLRFVGVEIEPVYFETACRRIEAAQRQGDLFVEPVANAMGVA